MIIRSDWRTMKADNRQEGNIPVYGSNGQIGWHDEKLADGPGVIGEGVVGLRVVVSGSGIIGGGEWSCSSQKDMKNDHH